MSSWLISIYTVYYTVSPDSTYLVIPRHSSENRKYIPIGFIAPEVIAGNTYSITDNISIYEFTVLISKIHMAWLKSLWKD